MADELILGAASQVLRPDAIDDLSSADSIEAGQSVVCRVMGKTWAPAGLDGEATVRRLYISGYHHTFVAFWVTPVVDGQVRNELREFCFVAAPASGRTERFQFILPLYTEHSDYPDARFGLRGTTFSAIIEILEPVARVYISQLTFAHEPLHRLAARHAEAPL